MIEQSLAGPIGTIVKVSTLQDYGVDKFFFLESNNIGTSQRNVVFVARGECARHAQSIAGELSVTQIAPIPLHSMALISLHAEYMRLDAPLHICSRIL